MEYLTLLNNFTPLGIIALALLIIYNLVSSRKEMTEVKENHLHGLPEMGDTLKRIEQKLEKLNDIENKLIRIDTKINGVKR